ncbi:MAG: flagellar motor protein MotB [Actinobacteria bacterium]|nr:flagellar motor protein MotB [Actinomycetota bacterium]
MSSHRHRRGGGGHAEEGHSSDERWLLTYSDMITLLMALFIIMWAISMVNKTKFDELRVSLREAFTHEKVLNGQTSVFNNNGASENTPIAIVPRDPASTVARQIDKIQSEQEQRNLQHLQQQLQQYAIAHGLSGELRTAIDERGLVIRLLTDKLLFPSGSAVLETKAVPLLDKVAQAIDGTTLTNPVRVEGNTDDVPIHTGVFQSNWELSTARATAVLEVLHSGGVADTRLSVAGYADTRPVDANTTPAGRQANRRVDIVVLRQASAPTNSTNSGGNVP